jgi:hypothetical protein
LSSFDKKKKKKRKKKKKERKKKLNTLLVFEVWKIYFLPSILSFVAHMVLVVWKKMKFIPPLVFSSIN